MTAAVDSGDGINGVRPSLGLAWADMVTMRLLLTREEGVENCGDSVQKVSKVIHMIVCQVGRTSLSLANYDMSLLPRHSKKGKS